MAAKIQIFSHSSDFAQKKHLFHQLPPPTLAFSITASDSANFFCVIAIFVVLLFLLVYFALALLVFVVLVSLVFAAEKIQKQFNITLLTLTIAELDIESRLSEHLSTSHPVSIILNPKLLLMQYFQKKQF